MPSQFHFVKIWQLAISSQLSAVGKEVFVKPKRVVRKRSGGVFAGVFLQIYVKALQLSNLPDRTARNN